MAALQRSLTIINSGEQRDMQPTQTDAQGVTQMSDPSPLGRSPAAGPGAPTSRTALAASVPPWMVGLLRAIGPRTPAQVVQRVMLALLVVAVLVLCVVNPTFRQTGNLLNIVQQASMVGVVACGMQLMIVSGGFNLSVGVVPPPPVAPPRSCRSIRASRRVSSPAWSPDWSRAWPTVC